MFSGGENLSKVFVSAFTESTRFALRCIFFPYTTAILSSFRFPLYPYLHLSSFIVFNFVFVPRLFFVLKTTQIFLPVKDLFPYILSAQ